MPPHPITVAVVDDSPRDEDFVHLALEKVSDISLIGRARHGAEIASLMLKCPDVLLLDVLVPRDASGTRQSYDIINVIREYAKDTRILISTHHKGRYDLMRELKRHTIYGYLIKFDTDSDQLITAIRDAYVGKQTISLCVQELMVDVPSPLKLHKLSETELTLLHLLGKHCDNRQPFSEIAEAMSIEPQTARSHASSIYKKLNVTDLHDLIAAVKADGRLQPAWEFR